MKKIKTSIITLISLFGLCSCNMPGIVTSPNAPIPQNVTETHTKTSIVAQPNYAMQQPSFYQKNGQVPLNANQFQSPQNIQPFSNASFLNSFQSNELKSLINGQEVKYEIIADPSNPQFIILRQVSTSETKKTEEKF